MILNQKSFSFLKQATENARVYFWLAQWVGNSPAIWWAQAGLLNALECAIQQKTAPSSMLMVCPLKTPEDLGKASPHRRTSIYQTSLRLKHQNCCILIFSSSCHTIDFHKRLVEWTGEWTNLVTFPDPFIVLGVPTLSSAGTRCLPLNITFFLEVHPASYSIF